MTDLSRRGFLGCCLGGAVATGAFGRAIRSRRTAEVFDVTRYGARGDHDGTRASTDNTVSIRRCTTDLAASGGGTLRFPRGRYRITLADNLPVAAWTSLSDVTIDWDGSELIVDRAFDDAQELVLFALSGCSRVDLGSPVLSCTHTQP